MDRAALANRLADDLRDKVLPYWYRTTIDSVSGGYDVADTHLTLRRALHGLRSRVRGIVRRPAATSDASAAERHIVSQSRLLYVFALAHRLGYGDGGQQYLEAADHGYRFLKRRMFDDRHGGFFWRVDAHGAVKNSQKWLYGQAFVLYAFAEFYRASGRPEVLADAIALFRLIQDRMRDREHGGWIELLDRDFSSLPSGLPTSETGIQHVNGLKSANGHLHLMEALSELFDVSRDDAVRAALIDVLRINVEVFFATPGVSPSHVTAEWAPVSSDPFGRFSFGHDVEFAWLMLRAQRVLNAPLDTKLFAALLSHSLDRGFDQARGGFYASGRRDDSSAVDTRKVWWVQAEGLAALTDALTTPGSGDHGRYERSLELLIEWIWRHQRLGDGTWVWSTDAMGRILNPTKADNWKAGYHEVRAITKTIGSLR